MTNPSRPYVVSEQISSPRMIAAVRAHVAIGSVPSVFRQYLDQVYAAAKSGAVKLDGRNVFVYNWMPERPNELDVAFGVGVTAPFKKAGSVVPVQLPTGVVATTTHWGSYAGLRAAHDAINDWCRSNNRRKTGASWEIYGHWTNDESQLRTDIFYLLEPVG